MIACGFFFVTERGIKRNFSFADITQDESYDIFKKCVKEIQKRLIINLANFKVTVVDKDGIRNLPDITAANLINYVP